MLLELPGFGAVIYEIIVDNSLRYSGVTFDLFELLIDVHATFDGFPIHVITWDCYLLN